jgi:hypothetical protein
MQLCVVKIDLVGSKAAATAAASNPQWRAQTLGKLAVVSGQCFPKGEIKYPTGTLYKTEGDAIYFLVSRPSVALRGAIEFMQAWVGVAATNTLPDARIVVDYGDIQSVQLKGHVDFVGQAFERIAILEKSVSGGEICLSEVAVKAIDRTMARFSRRPSKSEIISYRVEYLDPRTVHDSSLIHALFVADPKAKEARDRIWELFLIEYLLHNGTLNSHDNLEAWLSERNYPTLPKDLVEEIASRSTRFEGPPFRLTEGTKQLIASARKDFEAAKADCIHTVKKSLQNSMGEAVEEVNLELFLDEYLSAVFSEIRMMANYFRNVFDVASHDGPLLKKFDYVIQRHLGTLPEPFLTRWRTSLLLGLQDATDQNNRYIAALFHNVLATYYLNRSGQAGAFQAEKLRTRRVYIDTNVLYALLVRASSLHRNVAYVLGRLNRLDVPTLVFPFSIREYEHSLLRVEQEVKKDEYSAHLARWNPWLYQEYQLNKGRYLSNIELCRKQHSIAKGLTTDPENFDELARRLHSFRLELEREYTLVDPEKVEDLWTELRGMMSSSSWTLQKFYDFLYDDKRSPEKKQHDLNCIHNIQAKFETHQSDELGPKVLFVTLDKPLARVRAKYAFVMNLDQFTEYMLPYLFLADVPLIENEQFPNQLLGAQLGTLIVDQTLGTYANVQSWLQDPKNYQLLAEKEELGVTAKEIGSILSSQRFAAVAGSPVVKSSSSLSEVAEKLTAAIETIQTDESKAFFANANRSIFREQQQLIEKDQEISRLKRKLKYLKRQSRQKKSKKVD